LRFRLQAAKSLINKEEREKNNQHRGKESKSN